MADDKAPARKALDVAATAATAAAVITDVGVTGGLLAGGKLLWDGISAGVSWRRRQQAEICVQLVADALGEEDTKLIAAELASASENEAAWETLEEGFRAMMAAVHEDAKRCIAAVVADYVKRQTRPDRDYQLAGALLASCDLDLLRGLHRVVSEQARCPDVVQAHALDLATSQSGHWTWWANFPEHQNRSLLASPGAKPPTCFHELVQLLGRNEYARFPEQPQSVAPSSAGSDNGRGVLQLRVSKAIHLQRWRSLRLYLAPISVQETT